MTCSACTRCMGEGRIHIGDMLGFPHYIRCPNCADESPTEPQTFFCGFCCYERNWIDSGGVMGDKRYCLHCAERAKAAWRGDADQDYFTLAKDLALTQGAELSELKRLTAERDAYRVALERSASGFENSLEARIAQDALDANCLVSHAIDASGEWRVVRVECP